MLISRREMLGMSALRVLGKTAWAAEVQARKSDATPVAHLR
jgi:hypothetical protein